MLKNRLQDPGLLAERAYVNGEWIAADSGATLEVRDPATGDLLAQVPAMDAIDTRRAVEAAELAWPAWRARPAAERAALLERWFQAMIDHLDDLALIMTSEQGKPLNEAKGEIRYGAGFVKWFAEEARRVYGETMPAPSGDRRLLTLKQPVGVCAAITPWNFPNAMITRKCAPALAAGCPVIVKPSDLTPLSALALAVLAERVGIPAGVFNVLTGMPAGIGAELTGNPAVRKISFTGSTAVGRLLMRQSAEHIKRLSLELGGNAPFVVLDDADLEQAVAGVMISKFRNAGQTCVCVNRFLVQAGIHDRFVARLAERMGELMVGEGTQPGVTQGPLINQAAVVKTEQHIADALEHGARLLRGGERHPLGQGFFQPTLISEATTAMRVAREETFGPLAAVFRFTDEADAIALANDTDSGLAAYCYTRDLGRAFRMSEALEYGMVGINEGLISTEVAPFGGIKASGLGREGSRYGLEDYLEVRYTLMGGLAARE